MGNIGPGLGAEIGPAGNFANVNDTAKWLLAGGMLIGRLELMALSMEVGVGDIHLEEFANNLEMEVGVGSVRVEVDDTDYGLIHASAGVGDASIRGFQNYSDNERSFISADSYYHGDGDLEMKIEVGVGDVDVRNI